MAGAEARDREMRVGAMIFGLSTTLFLAMFIAPLTLLLVPFPSFTDERMPSITPRWTAR